MADGTSFPEHDAGRAAAAKLRVFLSYSRTDTKFADEVVAGLEYDGGFEVFIDRHSIHEGEEWRERLGGLIASADVVVFLLSKASSESPLCKWEADHAKELSKRIVPAQIEDVDNDKVSPTLKALNYVRFDEGRSFMAGLAALRRALKADLHWIREHTRILNRAQEWEAAGRSENRLLSGADIVAAKEWLERRPADAPPPLELHHEYIAASEQAETARLSEDRKQAEQLKDALGRSKAALTITVIAGVLAAGAGIAAGVLYFQTRDIGARAEKAVIERDTYIKNAEARDVQQEQQIAALEAERVRLVALVASGPVRPPPAPPATEPSPATPNDVTTGETDLGPVRARIADVTRRLEMQAGKTGMRWTAPPLPERAAGQSSKDYAAVLEKHVGRLENEYLVMLKSPPRVISKRPVPEPYNPSILRQQALPNDPIQSTAPPGE